MHHLMAKFWWILVLRGLLGVLLGITSVLWILNLENSVPDVFSLSIFLRPAYIVATLVLMLGFYGLLDGLFAVVLGAQDYGEGRRWWSLVGEGVLSMGMGLLAWLDPNRTPLLLYFIAAWAVITGALEIAQGEDLDEYPDRRKTFLFAGIISALFGLLVLYFRLGGVSLIWAMAAYAFLFGIPLLVLGFRLRRFAHAR